MRIVSNSEIYASTPSRAPDKLDQPICAKKLPLAENSNIRKTDQVTLNWEGNGIWWCIPWTSTIVFSRMRYWCLRIWYTGWDSLRICSAIYRIRLWSKKYTYSVWLIMELTSAHTCIHCRFPRPKKFGKLEGSKSVGATFVHPTLAYFRVQVLYSWPLTVVHLCHSRLNR